MKKAVSFILAAIMLIMLPAGAFADSAQCSCDTPPVVMVNGFGTELYHDNGDGTQSAVFPMGAVEIVSAIPSLAGAFAALAAGEHELFCSLLSRALFRLMGNMMCTADGTAKISAKSYQTPTDTDIHKKDTHGQYQGENDGGRYIFGYDWRLDPVESARELEKYIEQVKKITRHDKVVLCAHSEGTCVAASYISLYGSEDVEKVVFLSGAFQGITLVGNLFTKNLDVKGKADAFELFIETFLGGDTTGDFVSSLFSVLKDAFIVDMLLCLVNNILEEDLDALYDDCLTEIITTMPGVWSFVPDEYYENAKKALYSDTGDKYSALTKLTDNYHYNVQVGLGDRLKAEQKNGLAVCVSMGYAIAPIPVYDKCVDQTDMLIDTKFGSLGATCAPIGETLKADSTNKYLSNDLLVDASTCAFPDSTWFVRYQDHNDFCDAYNDFVYYLLTADGQPTVTSNAAFPQFMACDGHKVLVPAGALPEADTRPSIIRLGENTYKLIKELIDSRKN